MNHIVTPDQVKQVCRKLADAGGRAWLVGGCVRDQLLGRASSDVDIEVYGLSMNQVNHAMRAYGHGETAGKAFGVLKWWMDDLELDIALPRSERKIGEGHQSFEVEADPQLAPEQASRRRDFTINAMMFDPLNDVFLDLYGGKRDLQAGILKHVSPAFSEDPLRVLRAMQFAARFKLTLDEDTAILCRNLRVEAATLPRARIWAEWRKWGLASHPSYGLKVLDSSGWLALYPMLDALKGCIQDARWHPEGDVWTHTLMVVDQASRVAGERTLDAETRLQLLFAALCHDLGKPDSTKEDEQRHIHSRGHAQSGIPHARRFLTMIGAPKRIESYVLPLLLEHLVHLHGQATDRAVRRLAHRLHPSDMTRWEMLVEADASGCSRHDKPVRPALPWLQKARTIHTSTAKPTPLVTGKMLLASGIQPGIKMGEIIRMAYEAQLDGIFNDEKSARNWVKSVTTQHPSPKCA